jgi:hypothetical protein
VIKKYFIGMECQVSPITVRIHSNKCSKFSNTIVSNVFFKNKFILYILHPIVVKISRFGLSLSDVVWGTLRRLGLITANLIAGVYQKLLLFNIL